MKPLLLVYSLVLFTGAISARADWVAGRDLKANELPNGNGIELISPNSTVPEWSYGYRGTLNSTALTLFTSAQHTNSYRANNDVQGFTLGDGDDCTVNTGNSDVVFPALRPLHPNDMLLHSGPTNTNAFVVVRWTAPASGTYLLSAFWTDLDWGGGNGAEGAITVNGTAIFDGNFGNGGSTSTSFSQLFAVGDKVDFLLGPQDSYVYDSTAFNATITAVPEPARGAWLVCGLTTAALFCRHTRRIKL
jgi:hypothetical protein